MSSRNIQTIYYYGREVMKINRSSHAMKAFLNCIFHLQKNHYCARVAEIVDEKGTLIAVITRNIRGVIKVRYQHDSISTEFTLMDGTTPTSENAGMNGEVIAKITAEQVWVAGSMH